MKIKAKYETEDVKAMVIGAHSANFGLPPEGERWKCEAGYSGAYEVTNEPIPIPKPEPEPIQEEPEAETKPTETPENEVA